MKHLLVTSSLALSLSFGAAFAQQTPAAPQDTPQATPQGAPTQQSAPPEQGGRHRAPNPQKEARRLSKKLSLTPDQTAKLEPILATRDQQMQALRQNTQLSSQDRHQQMQTIEQQTDQQLSGVLTPDQMTQMKAMHHGRRGQDNAAPQTPSA